MNTFLLMLMAAAAGYAASIVSWPWLRQRWSGVENEIDSLRAKARALESKFGG